MQDIYETYYWQNNKVRLRAVLPEDAVHPNADDFDSDAWNMLSSEVVLPAAKSDGGAVMQDEKAPSFSIENLDGEYIGHIKFNYMNERHGTFSLGIIIWRRFRNNGYGKAAAELLLAYAFNERRLNKFNGSCLDNNDSSKKMFLSLGCTLEGTVREEVYINGRHRDRILYGLTAGEYKSRRADFNYID